MLRGLALVVPWLVWLLLIDLFVSALLPLSLAAPNLCYDWASAAAESVWAWIQLIFTKANSATITVSGDTLPAGESAVVVANHVAWSDFYMVQAVALRARMLGRCRYFAKTQLRWVPFLGWGLWALGMPLVSRRWDRDRRELDRVFQGITNPQRRWPMWLISFSEATRYTPQKYDEAVAWCRSASKQEPSSAYVLHPRTKGFVTTVQHLRQAPQVRAVYDLTIAYQRGSTFHAAPTMLDTLTVPRLSSPARNGQGYKFHVHVRRFPLEELPTTDDGLARWLEDRWQEKGLWLEEKKKEWAL